MTGRNADRLTGYVGRTGAALQVPDATPRRATVYGDGYVLAYFYVDGNTPAEPFDIDISGVDALRIHFQAIGPVEDRGVSLIMFDLRVHWD